VDSPEGPRREGNQIDLSVGLGNKDDGSEAWMIYGITRSAWIVKRFAETFPDEKEYRHSLAEEVEALRRVVDRVSTDMNEGRLKRDRLDVSIANLISLHETGLLEPFILFAKPDEGIVEDYERYREEHRDKLRQYLVDRVIGGK
jgi:hypothetical protein